MGKYQPDIDESFKNTDNPQKSIHWQGCLCFSVIVAALISIAQCYYPIVWEWKVLSWERFSELYNQAIENHFNFGFFYWHKDESIYKVIWGIIFWNLLSALLVAWAYRFSQPNRDDLEFDLGFFDLRIQTAYQAYICVLVQELLSLFSVWVLVSGFGVTNFCFLAIFFGIFHLGFFRLFYCSSQRGNTSFVIQNLYFFLSCFLILKCGILVSFMVRVFATGILYFYCSRRIFRKNSYHPKQTLWNIAVFVYLLFIEKAWFTLNSLLIGLEVDFSFWDYIVIYFFIESGYSVFCSFLGFGYLNFRVLPKDLFKDGRPEITQLLDYFKPLLTMNVIYFCLEFFLKDFGYSIVCMTTLYIFFSGARSWLEFMQNMLMKFFLFLLFFFIFISLETFFQQILFLGMIDFFRDTRLLNPETCPDCGGIHSSKKEMEEEIIDVEFNEVKA